MSLQLLILLVPVIFGLMGFALDLGRLWLIRGELNQAANAMALAAAAQMALGQNRMQAAANLALNETNGNRLPHQAALRGNSSSCSSSPPRSASTTRRQP